MPESAKNMREEKTLGEGQSLVNAAAAELMDRVGPAISAEKLEARKGIKYKSVLAVKYLGCLLINMATSKENTSRLGIYQSIDDTRTWSDRKFENARPAVARRRKYGCWN